MDTSAAGYFGKLPCAGDFVSRRLPRRFVQPWDAWLSRALAASLERFGASWLDDYLVSPFWRFVLSPGLCGGEAWAGVMMASVDRVGRAFPMTVAAPAGAGAFATVLNSEAWFSAVEDRLLAALQEEVNVTAFDQSLAGLPLQGGPVQPPAADAAAWRISLAPGNGDAAALSPLLDHLARNASQPYSCWATTGSPSVSASLLVCPGLPADRHFGAFIDGDWRQAGWADLPGRDAP